MLFTFEQLGGIDGVSRWMTAAERYREFLGRVMATRYAKESMIQDEMLNRIASLEAFHRTWSGIGENQMNLVRRLEGLVDHAGEPFEKLVGAGKTSTWCQKAKNHRNDIAHHLGRHPDLDVTELFYVGQAAYWLFTICMLREAGAPQEVFDHMVACRHFIWESSEIQGIL
ncbi:hypothetical protein GCM10017774_87820 [Lentzea cavernae]|uniref:Apea-like HEPN domain-containing protein n=2 Tax=Lentzea cavernae TaxID=2020703 RepID=A0ABQ3MVJ3_9PSEU|nr:hypothetical protein GCM10017774_87820 [Lentzea cavernae]